MTDWAKRNHRCAGEPRHPAGSEVAVRGGAISTRAGCSISVLDAYTRPIPLLQTKTAREEMDRRIMPDHRLFRDFHPLANPTSRWHALAERIKLDYQTELVRLDRQLGRDNDPDRSKSLDR